jgi:hypothetical protein
MPTLPWELFARELENGSAFDFQYDIRLIECIMLWPKNEGERARAALAGYVDLCNGSTGNMSRETLLSLQRLTTLSDTIETIRKELPRKQFEHGMITGSVLHHLVSLSSLGENTSIESVIAKCTTAFAKARRATNLKKNFDNKIWPHFRSVAHFWAAAYKHNVIEKRGAFPCRLIDLHEFLADAEAYRVKGESLRTPHSTNAVLRTGEAWRLPPRLSVAPSNLEFDYA